MLSRTKTHVRREKSSEKSINGQWCPLSAICRLKTHRFRHIFHCPQYFDLSDKKSLTCETVPLSVKPPLWLTGPVSREESDNESWESDDTLPYGGVIFD